MGYAITIARADDTDIDYQTWLDIAACDPDLRPIGESVWKSGSGDVRYQVFAWASGDENAGDAHFVYYDGRITIDHIHDLWVKKIGQVAAKMGCIATGDDGETYDANGNDNRTPKPEAPGFWARLFGR